MSSVSMTFLLRHHRKGLIIWYDKRVEILTEPIICLIVML